MRSCVAIVCAVGPLPLDQVGTLDQKQTFDIYRDRFADFSDFTFTFVGTSMLTPSRRLPRPTSATCRQPVARDPAPYLCRTANDR